MDKDESGDVSKAELAQFVKSTIGLESDVEDEAHIEEKFAEHNMEEVFNSFDKNLDGQITSDEID